MHKLAFDLNSGQRKLLPTFEVTYLDGYQATSDNNQDQGLDHHRPFPYLYLN